MALRSGYGVCGSGRCLECGRCSFLAARAAFQFAFDRILFGTLFRAGKMGEKRVAEVSALSTAGLGCSVVGAGITPELADALVHFAFRPCLAGDLLSERDKISALHVLRGWIVRWCRQSFVLGLRWLKFAQDCRGAILVFAAIGAVESLFVGRSGVVSGGCALFLRPASNGELAFDRAGAIY